MKILDLTRRAGRSLGNAKIRTLLTSLAIGVGAFTLTLTLAATAGANHYAEQLIKSNFDPSVLLVAKDKKIFGANTSSFDKPQEYDPNATGLSFGRSSEQYKRITDKDIATIKATADVESVIPSYQVSPQYITREGQKKYSVSLSAYNPGQRPDVSAGSLPKDGTQLTAGTVILPQSYVSALGFKDDNEAIGKTITVQLQRQAQIDSTKIEDIITQQGIAGLQALQAVESETNTFTITAVALKSATAISPTATLYIQPTDAGRLSDFQTKGTNDFHKYLTAEVRVNGGNDVAKRNTVKEALTKKGYNVETVEDLQKLLLQIISILQGIVTGFGVIALIASVFGIINTQYISVLERTREIGLMKALGMRKVDIGWLFRIEAAWIGFLGGVIGSSLAFIVGTLINPWLNKTLSLGEGNYLLIFQIMPIVMLIIGLMIIAILAGWLPARKAAKLDPIEALRTE